MRIISMEGSSKPVYVIECTCGATFPSTTRDSARARCPNCGAEANICTLRRDWKEEDLTSATAERMVDMRRSLFRKETEKSERELDTLERRVRIGR